MRTKPFQCECGQLNVRPGHAGCPSRNRGSVNATQKTRTGQIGQVLAEQDNWESANRIPDVPSQAAINRAKSFASADANEKQIMQDARGIEEAWFEARQESRKILGDEPFFVHFTSAEHADAIISSGSLTKSSTIVDSVYAVPVGGSYTPGVQRGVSESGFGAVKGLRTHAVVFRSPRSPEVIFPEECIWRDAEGIQIVEGEVWSAEEASELLDGSLELDENLF